MGRDTIQLEDVVSIISVEYLLEFTSEYGIPEGLHPELPGPEETIVDFPEELEQPILLGGREDIPHRRGVAHKRPKDGMPPADSYSSVDVTTLDTCRTPIQKQPKVLLCLVGLSRNFFLGDDVYGLVQPDQCPKSDEGEDRDPTPHGGHSRTRPGERIVNKRRRKRGNDKADANAPPKVLRKDHAASRLTQSTLGGKSLASMGLEAGSTFSVPASQETPTDVSDPDPLSYAKPQPIPEQDIAQPSKGAATAGDPDSEKFSSFTSMVGSPGSIYQQGWGVTNNCRLDTP
ncbi:hypothetical protein Tco_1460914, partial [Tanacetum coccineum]